MATIRDSMTWVAYEAQIKAMVGVTGSGSDSELEALLDVSAEWFDSYLENPFVDGNGDDIALPLGVVNTVLKGVKLLFEADESGIMTGTTGVRTRDLSVNFGGAGFDPETIFEGLSTRVYKYRNCIFR